MAKKTKKTALETAAEQAGHRDGFYEAKFGGERAGDPELLVEVRDGMIARVDDEPLLDPMTADEWCKENDRAVIGKYLGELSIGELLEREKEREAQKNAPEAAATATEADLSPREEEQTKSNMAKKKKIRKPVLRTLRFPLSALEIEAKCSGIAKKARAVEELEAEISRIKSDYKGRVEKLQMEIKRDLTAVEEREEPREVMADEVHDYEACVVLYEFNGQTYEQREMTPRERQLEIDGVL